MHFFCSENSGAELAYICVRTLVQIQPLTSQKLQQCAVCSKQQALQKIILTQKKQKKRQSFLQVSL